MLFKVPLPYKVKGTPKGRKNETDEQFWEYVEVDIQVLTDEAAPIAVTWDDSLPEDCTWLKHKDDWLQAQAVPGNGIQIMRMKEGEFYLRRPDGLTPDVLASRLNPQGDLRIFGESFIEWSHRKAERPVEETPYRQDKEFSSTFDAEVAKLRRAADRFFIVGDEIYEPSSEPVVIKFSYRTDDGAAVAPRVIPSGKVDKMVVTHRVDKYAQVVAELAELNARFGDRHRVSMDRAPTVHLAQAVGFNDLEVNLVNAVRTHIEKFSDHERLKTTDPDSGIAFLQLRKAMNEFDKSGDISVLEAAAGNLVENFPEAVRFHHLASSYRAFADRPVDTLSVGSWRKNR
ncbi:hypothetical protein HFO56_24125 [Rhizobium laguerreae]|uniref:hypothetical protein n=1 Tax=Rhizobium laguerreae TaxID=1076926 RepID=UPI001C91B3A9|nr:hypothetical protein [Rhizobium laguerreae]MBY3155417.1 hypothetical protein [Rhizobium laguerreae]